MTANPYGVPLAAGMDYWGATTPSSAFAFPAGQAISRTTYASLFALIGTTYGAGDGSTTFNIPDLRGRVVAGKGDMGGTAANRLTVTYFGADGNVLGSVGGAESHTLSAAQLPALNVTGSTSGSLSVSGSVNNQYVRGGVAGSISGGGSLGFSDIPTFSGSTSGSLSVSGTVSGTSGAAHNNAQPTIIANRIMRVL